MRLDEQVKNTVDGEIFEPTFSALWIFVCPYKEVLYLNIDNSCSYVHFFI